MGCKWMFVRKQDKFGNVSKYKVWLIAQGFTPHLGFDHEETYFLVMDSITFRCILSLAVNKKLETRLMDVVTTNLYGSMNIDICAKVPT